MADNEDQEDDSEAAGAAAEGKGKKKKLMLLGGIGVLLLALAGGGTWFALHSMGGGKDKTAATEEGAHADVKAAEGGHAAKRESLYEALDPAFLANYTVGGRQHYLQLAITVLAREQSGIDGLHQHMPLVRNRVVMLLSGETFETLQTDDGRVQLQQKLLAAIQEILNKETGKPGIEQVFFTNFVMQ